MFDSATTIGLLLTLVMIFSFQGNTILGKPLHNVGLRVKMCVWLGVSRGLDLAFLNAD